MYLASPVSLAHGSYDVGLGGWLNHYAYVSGRDLLITGNTTLLGADDSFLQPDVAVIIGRRMPSEAGYLAQVPDLIVEISYSSRSYDLGPKVAAYRSAGLPEYITVLLQEQRVEWRVLSGTRYRPLESKDAILRSPHHPGLWLDTEALFPYDRNRLLKAVDRGVAVSQ